MNAYGERPLRLLGFLLAASVLAAIALKVGLSLRQPTLYEGDKVETRSCRWCGGSGKDSAQAQENPQLGDRCSACSGSGKVEVILPGPNHPTLVRGVLVDESETSELDTYDSWNVDRTQGLNPTPHKGVVKGGHVKFVGKTTVEADSGSHGLITATLPPDSYTVIAESEGFLETKGELVIAPLTEPLWNEKANILYEPESQAHGQGLYGVQILITLGKGDRPGRIVRSLEPSPVP